MKLSPADKSMLITFTGASLLVLVFFFLGVKPYEDPNPEETFIEIPVVQEYEEEEEEIARQQLNQQRLTSHRAYNSSKLRQESKQLFEEEDLVRKAIEEQQLSSVEDLISETENALEESKKSRELAIAERKELIKQQIEARELERERNKGGNRESTVSYHLPKRTAYRIPNPVYTCDAQGTIVLNITVNAKGAITQMEYNKNASTSSNGCLIDQALEYANQALFSSSTKVTQLGSITFSFQG